MPIATLIAPETLPRGDLLEAADRLNQANLPPDAPQWREAGRAADIAFMGSIADGRAALRELEGRVDVVVQAEADRSTRRLLVSDMDSTMITAECIDELADYAGIKAEIADVTERAMRGELDFAEALRARVSLLAGLDETVIETCLAERVTPMPGAETLVKTLAAQGWHCLLVSGGFTRFAEPVAARLGFHGVLANRLTISEGRLSGTVDGDIVDAAAKAKALRDTAARLNLPLSATMALGDGANDLPMVEEAGLGVAFRAKPKLDAAADASIRHCDLTALLHALAIPRSEWIEG